MSEQAQKQGESQNPKKKKSSCRRFKIATLIILICVLAVYIYFVLIWKSESQKNSEKLILKAAAYQLNKKTEDLTDEDFVKVTKLSIENYETMELLHKDVKLYDIKLIKKFVNLQELDLSYISYPDPEIPKWMVILGKIHVLDLHKSYHKHYMNKYLLDLRPLENLSNLQVIRINGTPIKDITPLAKLDNLKEIHMNDGQLDQFGIFKGGAVPETVFIHNKEYKLEFGMWPPSFRNKFSKDTDPNEVSPLPTIKCYIPDTFVSELQYIELMIKIEVEKALE